MNEIERAIKDFEDFKVAGYTHYALPSSWHIELAITALRDAAERENPKPLTLAELRERGGKPVWIVSGFPQDKVNGWFLADISHHDIEQTGERIWTYAFYDTQDAFEPDEDFYAMYHNDPAGQYGLHVLGWLAYDHPPKEATP